MSTIGNADIVLLNTFVIFKKRFRVFFHSGSLVWEKEKENSSQAKNTVPVTDIISITAPKTDDHINNTEKPPTQRKYFTIHYAKSTNSNKWRQYSVTMHNADFRTIDLWVQTIQDAIDAQIHRPKRLLLFVNPFGGKQQAFRIYEKYGKPIFRLANIDVSVVVSQRPNQIRDIIKTQSFTHYDGIVCVGGDGTFSEVFNGLIFRTISDLGLDTKQPTYIPQPDIPIGVIPGGSTDTVAYCMHGTTDIQTSVIHIVLGQINGLDLSSVSNNVGLIRFYASVMSYGYLGDVANDSEKFRWMGPSRYDFSGFKKFILNRGYEGELSILLDNTNSSPNTGPGCYENCLRCSNSTIEKSVINFSDDKDVVTTNYYHLMSTSDVAGSTSSGDQWKIVNGTFFMINGANLSCACVRSPNGFAKYCHIGDGCVDLVLIRHTTLLNNFRLLLTLSRENGNISDLPFVEIYRAKKFSFRAPPAQNDCNISSSTQPIRPLTHPYSLWNCDGEVIGESDVTVRSHCQLIKVYRRGLLTPSEEDDEHEHTTKCGFCSI